jgi:hypothetical protein
VGGFNNRICGYDNDSDYGSCNSSIVGGNSNIIYCSSCLSTIIGGCDNRICDYSCQSSIIGGYSNDIVDNNEGAVILGGRDNRIDDNSDFSIIVGGWSNDIFNCSCQSTIIGGRDNIMCNCSINSSIIGGNNNTMCCSYQSAIIGGCDNRINCCSSNSSIIGGYYNIICCSSNSVIIGGSTSSLIERDNTILLNGTTNFKQTIEASETVDISATPYSIDFMEGAIKYINSTNTDFEVDFINVPAIPNTTITYTLIINQGATPYMVTGVTVNTNAQTIKWANATEPEGNSDQVDIVGLMFIFNGSGLLTQVLGQMGTFA